MQLFRVENQVSNAGLWYRTDTQEMSNVVHQLALTGAGLPMDFDPAIAAERWKSAAYNLDQLKFWFTVEDLQKLIPLGYALYSIEAMDVREHVHTLYQHALYKESRIITSNPVDINILLQRG